MPGARPFNLGRKAAPSVSVIHLAKTEGLRRRQTREQLKGYLGWEKRTTSEELLP
jgi:hypothetical protein